MRLSELGYKNKWSTWIPHNMSPNYEQEQQWIVLPFIDRIITSDEKWIMCNNYGKERACLQPNDSVQRPRVSRYRMKFLFCIFRNSSWVLFYGLLEKDQTVTWDIYCRQLTEVAEKYRSFYGRTTNTCQQPDKVSDCKYQKSWFGPFLTAHNAHRKMQRKDYMPYLPIQSTLHVVMGVPAYVIAKDPDLITRQPFQS